MRGRELACYHQPGTVLWARFCVSFTCDMRILAICGSLQAKSGNLALLSVAAASVPDGVELVLFDGLRDLPHFNPDIEASGVPESVLRWRQALEPQVAALVRAVVEAAAAPPGARPG